MERLTILFDTRCGFCLKVAEWLSEQETYFEIELLAARGKLAAERYPELQDVAGEEMLAIDDSGGVYRGSAAYIIILYALKRYREWSFRLSSPLLFPIARKAFHLVSQNRSNISALLRLPSLDQLQAAIEKQPAPVCEMPPNEKRSSHNET